MTNHLNPDTPATAADVAHFTAVMAELSLDLMRSIRAAVPIALHETLAGALEPALIERVAEVIFAETDARYRVAAAATLLTVGGPR
jgi:hypothetical protein